MKKVKSPNSSAIIKFHHVHIAFFHFFVFGFSTNQLKQGSKLSFSVVKLFSLEFIFRIDGKVFLCKFV